MIPIRRTFTGAVPPALPSWPPDQANTPPCTKCGTPMTDVPQFQVNLIGPLQLAAGQPAVEVADVVHVCPVCGTRFRRRFQRGS